MYFLQRRWQSSDTEGGAVRPGWRRWRSCKSAGGETSPRLGSPYRLHLLVTVKRLFISLCAMLSSICSTTSLVRINFLWGWASAAHTETYFSLSSIIKTSGHWLITLSLIVFFFLCRFLSRCLLIDVEGVIMFFSVITQRWQCWKNRHFRVFSSGTYLEISVLLIIKMNTKQHFPQKCMTAINMTSEKRK